MKPETDIDIARAAQAQPIAEVAAKLGIPETALSPYGRTKAKIETAFVDSLSEK